jgi:hypothetical protein
MSIKGTVVPTGILATNAKRGEIAIRLDYRGKEVGLVLDNDGVYWQPRDFDKIIYELIKFRDAMKEEGLL